MDRQRLDAAVELACSAKAIMEDEGLLSSSRQKGEFDFVTRIDLSVEQHIREGLRARFPEDQFLGEEEEAGAFDPERPLWILDPVDGTTNLRPPLPAERPFPGADDRRRDARGRDLQPLPRSALHRAQGRRSLPQRPAHPRIVGRRAARGPGQRGHLALHPHARRRGFQVDAQSLPALSGHPPLRRGGAGTGLRSRRLRRSLLRPRPQGVGLRGGQGDFGRGGRPPDHRSRRRNAPPPAPSSILATNGLVHEEMLELLREMRL